MRRKILGALRPDGWPVLIHIEDHATGESLCGSTPYPDFEPPTPREDESYPGCPECMDIFMAQVQEHGMAMVKSLAEERVTLREALRALQDLDLEIPLDRAKMAVNLGIMVSSLGAEADQDIEADHD